MSKCVDWLWLFTAFANGEHVTLGRLSGYISAIERESGVSGYGDSWNVRIGTEWEYVRTR